MLYQTQNVHGGDIYTEEVRLDFSANTNPFGTPQGVLRAVQNCLQELHHYPDPCCRSLIRAISEFEQVPQEYILCGNGAAELIYSYCEAAKPRLAVELAPTFSEYSLGLKKVGCEVYRYLLRQENDFLLDEKILTYLNETVPHVVFLCNPNNPTGKTIPVKILHQILTFCADKDIRLFVDECFLDLSDGGRSIKRSLQDHPNLFVLKAFTKSYGMAGLRLGYCMTSDSLLLTRMSQTVQPWNVSIPAQAAGIAALKETGFLKKTRELIVIERSWLKTQLESLGFRVCNSEANYLLFQGPEGLQAALKKEKIAVRSCDNYHGLGAGWYRIAVRRHEENEMLIDAMKRICGRMCIWQKTS